MKHRRAISILELLLIMSASTVVLSLTGVLLHRAMITQIQSRSRTNAENTSLRLANQFRRDVHNAREVKPDNAHAGAGVFLRLTASDDRTIEYARENGNILRIETGGPPARRELFEFPRATQLTIELVEAPPRLTLTVKLQASDQPPPASETAFKPVLTPIALHVEAAIGRNLKLHAPASKTEPAP